jgi:hypothetical protein
MEKALIWFAVGSSSNRLGRGEPHLLPCGGEDAPPAGELFVIVVGYIGFPTCTHLPEVVDELPGYGVRSDHPRLRLLLWWRAEAAVGSGGEVPHWTWG